MARKKPAAAALDGAPRLIGLIRVSTTKQEESGLGLEAQTAAIERYRQSVGGILLRSYTEVESGKLDDVDSRPRLRAAVADALFARATLVIAKIDRLYRSVPVMGYLEKRKVKFVACDNPHANKLTTDILGVVASAEAIQISNRTKDALGAYRKGGRVSRRIREMYPDGVPPEVAAARAGKLGAELPECRNLSPEAQALGTIAAARKRAGEAAEAYDHLLEAMARMRADGQSLRAIAARLNELGHRTRQGHPWNHGQVRRVLDRARTA
jgi:DNA invertase Pin-like site-specific DNA recombinase